MSKRILITGGPGFGKTSIVQDLASRGYAVSQEKAREVIKKQIELKSDKLPWEDVYGFSQLVIDAIVKEKIEDENYIFCDRGIPDVLGYMKNAGLEFGKEFYKKELRKMGYSQKVFFVPVWEDIYVQDEERKESLLEAIQISECVKNAYIEEGFELIEIPKSSIEYRSDFILFSLASHQF